MKGLSLYIAFLLLLCSGISMAQDYRFSQYYNAPVLLNPALSGSYDMDYRLNMNYRNQWSSISNAFRTVAGSFDMPMFEDIAGMSKLGFGLSFLSDKAGTTNFGYNNINLSLAYHFKTDRFTKFGAGIMLGYGQHAANLDNVKWESQHNGSSYDGSLPSGESFYTGRFSYFDAGVGLLWTSIDPYLDRNYEVGISAVHVNFPNNSFIGQYRDRLRPKLQLHAEMDLGYDGFMLKPKLLIQNQGPAYSATIGSLIRFRLGSEPDSRYTDVNVSSAFDLGFFYRYRESVMVTAQYEFKKRLLLAVSYDILIAGLSKVSSAGGFEIGLQYRGMFVNKRLKIKNKLFKEEKKDPGQKKDKNAPNIRM